MMQKDEALRIVKREIPLRPRTMYGKLVKEALTMAYTAFKKAPEKPHGRLIDADALIESLSINPEECPGCPEPEFLQDLINIIDYAEVVVEPEDWRP